MPFYINEFEPDIVLTLLDIWCAPWLVDLTNEKNIPYLRHITQDTANLTGFWLNECKVRETSVPIAFSKFCRRTLNEHGVDWGAYIPHGVDTKTYRPLKNPDERRAIRKRFGVPEDAFIVGMVAHNQMRKAVDRWLYAFKEFSVDKPDAYAILHCMPKDQMGWDLNLLIQELGLVGKVYFTSHNSKMGEDAWVTEEDMRRLYCSFDVHMLLTGGEGFGLPLLESMACGIPNVATAWTSPIEFFAEEKKETIIKDDGTQEDIIVLDCQRGLLVDVETVLIHHTGGEWAAASASHAAKMLQLFYDEPNLREGMGKRARRFVVRDYRWPRVLREWDKVIDNPEKYMKPKKQPHKKTLGDLGI